MTPWKPALLPPAAADSAAGARLIKIEEEDKTSIINCSLRSTHPSKKSVQTTEATPLNYGSVIVLGRPADAEGSGGKRLRELGQMFQALREQESA